VPGTRAVVFVTAGIRAVPVKVFLDYDCVGALRWVPAMLPLGHLAGDRIGGISELADR
jgi:membrane protein DedA with SNARE-associated domain